MAGYRPITDKLAANSAVLSYCGTGACACPL